MYVQGTEGSELNYWIVCLVWKKMCNAFEVNALWWLKEIRCFKKIFMFNLAHGKSEIFLFTTKKCYLKIL